MMDSAQTRTTATLEAIERHPQIAHPGTINTSHDHMRRTKSLSRPERHRPRQGILRSTDGNVGQYHQFNNNNNSNIYQQQHHRHYGRRIDQPMSQELAQQLAQYRKDHIRQQLSKQDTDLTNNRQSGDRGADRKSRGKKERGASNTNVRAGWWAWVAFLATCCFPSCCIRLCFGKSNSMMRQAWREKVLT